MTGEIDARIEAQRNELLQVKDWITRQAPLESIYHFAPGSSTFSDGMIAFLTSPDGMTNIAYGFSLIL
jgi:hypothetical protein